MDAIKEELQKQMAVRFDTEFNEVSALIDKAYEQGLSDGKRFTQNKIINMIQGDSDAKL
jgi:hypothetical protein